MAEIPQEVLSEHFQEHMAGRRLISAVFFTYQFEPDFFETEVLPVFLDIPLSHAREIRLVQLEDQLRSLPGHLAVYYDAGGLVRGDGSARLDVRRIPLRHHTGVFHPKNVFALLEEVEPDEDGHHERTLLIASMSANLTRSGWWRNVEACHVETLAEGERTRLKDDLLAFLDSVRRKASAEMQHAALRDIVAFLRTTEQRAHRTSDDQLHPHFYGGTRPLADFLEECTSGRLRGLYLEVIAPFFDDRPTCEPLDELIERFEPKEVRIFLPRSDAGAALVRRELYEYVRALDDVAWSRLPNEILQLGSASDAGKRYVHAKVYRFFRKSPKTEYLFIGSANLTSAAHQNGGNVESGVLVQILPPRAPEFWLAPDEKRPQLFEPKCEDEPSTTAGTPRLQLRYHWDRAEAEAFWDAPGQSPELHIEARGIALGAIDPLPSRTWTKLPDLATALSELLRESSFVTVHGEGEHPLLVLVMEEGMSHKPSLLLQLSAADILRYWSLLTPEQRAAFLESKAAAMVRGEDGHLVIAQRLAAHHDTLFDRFAGFFHAFGCLERAVREALEQGNDKEAKYRLFGKKYDSLGSLLDRVFQEDGDAVDRYVIVLCARQLCSELARAHAAFWEVHATDAEDLAKRFEQAQPIRENLIAADPKEMPAFLDWFDGWFLRRAELLESQP